MAKIFPLKAAKLKELRKEYIHTKNEIAIRPAVYTVNSENSIGDLLFESKNVYFAFDSIRTEDCRYTYDSIDVKDSMDIYHVGWAELMYECHAITNVFNGRFVHFCYDNSNITYCDCVQNSKNLFGCAGLNQKKYCILNKQYTKEEYEELVPKIIAHMKKTGEWGEFFPINLSPFAYNQSRVQEFFPLTKEETLAQGYRWSDYEAPAPQANKTIPTTDLPETIQEIDDDILSTAILCEISNKHFGIVKQELAFYRKNSLPLPRRHPDQRYLDRIAQRTPQKLWQRPCTKCGKEMWSSHAISTPAKAYCQNCYLSEVY